MKLQAAGDLDRVIQILRSAETRDALNEQILAWPVLAAVHASYTPVSDGERYAAGEIGAFEMARFSVRHSSLTASMDTRDRILFDGKTWEISGVKPVGRNRLYEITAFARPDTQPR